MAARLQHQLHDIAMSAGTFVIGRGADCQLALDDVLVSRRHAAIRVADDGSAVLEDLNSRNGVFLNGVRVEKEASLNDGDLIRIGSQDICFYRVGEGDGRATAIPRATRVTMQYIPRSALEEAGALGPGSRPEGPVTAPAGAEPPAARPEARPETGAEGAAPSSRSHPSVRRASKPASVPAPAPPAPPAPSASSAPAAPPGVDPDDDLEEATTVGPSPFGAVAPGKLGGLAIIGSVADKALALGRADEAERILQRSLAEIQARAAKGETDLELAERAAGYAVRLAAATGRGAWIDFVFQLYTAHRALLPARLVDELYAAVRKVKATDKAVLRAYTSCLKQISTGFGPAERFVLQRIEGFERWAP